MEPKWLSIVDEGVALTLKPLPDGWIEAHLEGRDLFATTRGASRESPAVFFRELANPDHAGPVGWESDDGDIVLSLAAQTHESIIIRISLLCSATDVLADWEVDATLNLDREHLAETARAAEEIFPSGLG